MAVKNEFPEEEKTLATWKGHKLESHTIADRHSRAATRGRVASTSVKGLSGTFFSRKKSELRERFRP